MAQFTDQNIISSLEPLAFGDLVAPCRNASYDIEYDLPERRYAYLNGAAHDNIGRGAIVVNCELLFLNSIEPGLFVEQFDKWNQIALTDGGRIETLIHPILGELDVRLKSFRVSLVADNRDGVVVDATFVETLKEVPPPEQRFVLPGSPTDFAAAIDQDYAIAGIDYPDGMPSTDLFGMVDSVIGQVGTFAKSITGAINSIQGKVSKVQSWARDSQDITAGNALRIIDTMINTVRQSSDPRNWVIEAKLEALYDQIQQKGRALGNPAWDNKPVQQQLGEVRSNNATNIPDTQPVGAQLNALRAAAAADSVNRANVFVDGRKIVVTYFDEPVTLTQAASLLSADVDDLINLNLGLLASPLIAAHTPIKYFLEE